MELLRKLFALILIFMPAFLSPQPFDAIISLGSNCQPAWQMYINGLREYALPFDKLITSSDAIEKMLQHHFEGFLEPENFELIITDTEKYILDKKFGTRLIHDFKLMPDFLKEYEAVKTIYERRIERLFRVISESEYPLFIRKNITKDQAIALRDLLSQLRLNKPFLLVALDHSLEIAQPWNMDNVRNFYLRQPNPATWKGDNEAWQEIFIALGLQLSPKEDAATLKVLAEFFSNAESHLGYDSILEEQFVHLL